MSQEEYNARKKKIAELAGTISETVLDSQQNDDGTLITDSAEVEGNISKAVSHGIFSQMGENGEHAARIGANAIRNYVLDNGTEPPQELLASVANSIANVMDTNNPILDSTLNSTDGIPFRDHMISLQLPQTLNQITGDDVTYIPAGFDKSEIFRVERVAGSTFGDLNAGDVIDEFFSGQYSTMDQIKLAGTTDGSAVSFVASFGNKIKPHRTMVYIDGELLVHDLDGGQGDVIRPHGGGNITLSQNFVSGDITVTLSGAGIVASGLKVEVKADILVENNEEIIPLVDHQVTSYIVRPHEAVLASSTTIQARMQLQRELGLNQDTMNIAAAANIMAAEKDRRNIYLMRKFARDQWTWGLKPPVSGADSTVEHMRTLRSFLAKVSSEQIKNNKKAGGKSLYVGRAIKNFLEILPAGEFTMVANYVEIAQPHVVGRLFGRYTVKFAPQMGEMEMMMVAKGTDHGDSGLIVGDAIPAIAMKHVVAYKNLRNENTLYELAVRDMHPYKGRDFVSLITFNLTTTGEQ